MISRDVITAADDCIFRRLNLITNKLIKEKPANAIWRLGLLVVMFDIKKHGQLVWSALAETRRQIVKTLNADKKPELILLISGILHEKNNKVEAALSEYGYARNKYPHCWHAYLKPAAMLQKLNRYQESINLLEKMQMQLDGLDNKPNKKSMNEFNKLIARGRIYLSKNCAQLTSQFGAFQQEKAPVKLLSQPSRFHGPRK
jgi:tetratricopeptide (TPR) repeat protein